MSTSYLKANFTGKDQYARTPNDVMEILRDRFNGGNEFFDPCPVAPTFDGLSIPWPTDEGVYCNPPYNNLPAWMAKVVAEARRGSEGRAIVCLIPNRTDVNWYHDLVMAHASKVYFIKQGVRFNNTQNKPYNRKCPFPVCVALFHKKRPGSLVCESIDFYEKEKEALRLRIEKNRNKRKRKNKIQDKEKKNGITTLKTK